MGYRGTGRGGAAEVKKKPREGELHLGLKAPVRKLLERADKALPGITSIQVAARCYASCQGVDQHQQRKDCEGSA